MRPRCRGPAYRSPKPHGGSEADVSGPGPDRHRRQRDGSHARFLKSPRMTTAADRVLMRAGEVAAAVPLRAWRPFLHRPAGAESDRSSDDGPPREIFRSPADPVAAATAERNTRAGPRPGSSPDHYSIARNSRRMPEGPGRGRGEPPRNGPIPSWIAEHLRRRACARAGTSAAVGRKLMLTALRGAGGLAGCPSVGSIQARSFLVGPGNVHQQTAAPSASVRRGILFPETLGYTSSSWL